MLVVEKQVLSFIEAYSCLGVLEAYSASIALCLVIDMHCERDSMESIIATFYSNYVETVVCTSEIRGNTAMLSSIRTVFL